MQAAENCRAIQEKILRDAKSEAAELINAAKKNAAQKLASVKEQLEQEKAEKLATSHASLTHEAEQLARMKRNEHRKSILEIKQKMVFDVFERAYVKLLKMDKTDMDGIVDSLVSEYANADDVVTKIDGGVIISNSFYDIKITIQDLLADLRDDIENEVAKILFGGS